MFQRIALLLLIGIGSLAHSEPTAVIAEVQKGARSYFSSLPSLSLPSFNTVWYTGTAVGTIGIEALQYSDFYHRRALLHPTATLSQETLDKTRSVLKASTYSYADTVPLYPLNSHFAALPIFPGKHVLYINPVFAAFCTSEHPAYQTVYTVLLTYAAISLKYNVSVKRSCITAGESITANTALALTLNHKFFEGMSYFKSLVCSVAIGAVYNKCLHMLTSAYFSHYNTALLHETVQLSGQTKAEILEAFTTVLQDPQNNCSPALAQFLHNFWIMLHNLKETPLLVEPSEIAIPENLQNPFID